MDGLTVAQTEYDRELKARRDAEAEVTRLRVLLSGQAVRLSAISGESKRHEAQKQLSQELSDNLSTLERSLSKLKVERDMTLAEVEQLSASRRSVFAMNICYELLMLIIVLSSTTVVDSEDSAVSLTRALSMRFDNIKNQYQHELLPLTEQREALMREITELKASRDSFLEETTMLNARNEELAQLNAQYVRRVENARVEPSFGNQELSTQDRSDTIYNKARTIQNLSSSVTSSTVALTEESTESKFVKISKPDAIDSPAPQSKSTKFIKWPGSRTPKDNVTIAWPDNNKPNKGRKEHVFQQISVLRVARCDHCGDKMWGSQFRCTSECMHSCIHCFWLISMAEDCNIAVHTRCVHHVGSACSQQAMNGHEPPLPSVPLRVFYNHNSIRRN